MDAFYASVEQRHDSSLKGKPLVVGGAPPRGVVAAASYEAREYGIHSAMPMAQAVKLCPALVVMPVRMAHYVDISRRVFAIFASYSPLVEALSLDEAFIDISSSERLVGKGSNVAREIKERVRQELGLVVSVGVAPNKFVAKIASDIGKPDGLVVVKPGEVEGFLHPLPVTRLFGVGKVTEQRLHRLGIRTIGQLAAFSLPVLTARIGAMGQQLWELAHGNDQRPLEVDRAAESIGHEDTFAVDLDDLEELQTIVREQADRVAARLRAQGKKAATVMLKAKTAGFKLRTRRGKLRRPTSDGNLLGEKACELLARLHRGGIGPLRLTGVTALGLSQEDGPGQLGFEEPEEATGEKLGQALDLINARYGDKTVIRGSSLKRGKAD